MPIPRIAIPINIAFAATNAIAVAAASRAWRRTIAACSQPRLTRSAVTTTVAPVDAIEIRTRMWILSISARPLALPRSDCTLRMLIAVAKRAEARRPICELIG
jgi:hypothetical protein